VRAERHCDQVIIDDCPDPWRRQDVDGRPARRARPSANERVIRAGIKADDERNLY
jgi:hypothetical protein